jgi:hypothetical protein
MAGTFGDIPDIPSGALYGDSLKCTIVSELGERPRLAITLPITPRPKYQNVDVTDELELNNGALAVTPYGDSRRNIILPSNAYPAWVYQILELMRAEGVKAHIYTVESGRLILAAPLRWKAGGDPVEATETISVSQGGIYSVQYDTSTGLALKALPEDRIPIMGYAPGSADYAPFPLDAGAFCYKGGQNLIDNAGFTNEGLVNPSMPADWSIVSAVTPEDQYGVLDYSFLEPDLKSVYLAKPSSVPADFAWESASFSPTGSSNCALFVGYQTFGATGEVEIDFGGGVTRTFSITDTYASGVIRDSFSTPAGTPSAVLRLKLTSSTGEIIFTAPQVLDARCHTHMVGVGTDRNNATWSGSQLSYALPTPFNPNAGTRAVAFCYIQPGWTSGICTSERVLTLEASDHNSGSLSLEIGGGLGGAHMSLKADGSLLDTENLTGYTRGDSFLCLLSMDDTKVYADIVMLSDPDTVYSCDSTTLPSGILDKLWVGSDESGAKQLDGIIGGVTVLNHDNSEGTISQMLDYLSNEHVIDVARNTLGRSYYLKHNLTHGIRKKMYRGTVEGVETEKY